MLASERTHTDTHTQIESESFALQILLSLLRLRGILLIRISVSLRGPFCRELTDLLNTAIDNRSRQVTELEAVQLCVFMCVSDTVVQVKLEHFPLTSEKVLCGLLDH